MAIEPVLDSAWNGGVGMISHDVRHVLEDLQVLDGEGFALVSVILVRLFELREILKNVPFEFCPVEARDSGGGTELYLFAADLDSFLKSKLTSANVMDNILSLPDTAAAGWQT